MPQHLPLLNCAPPAAPALADEEADRVAATFKALSDPVRVKLLHHISANCCSSVCACHMPGSLGISQPTLSYHLARLVKAGLISKEMRHKWAHYHATPQGLATARAFLAGLPDPAGCSTERDLTVSDTKPSVLFVCIHNAGRSQMAAGYLRHLAGDRIEVRSAGSLPADQINPVAVEAMLEEGIDITAEQPKVLTAEAVRASDVVVTMGCGDACPYYPGRRYEDWKLEDPAGQGIESVRPIRDEIRARIEALVVSLGG